MTNAVKVTITTTDGEIIEMFEISPCEFARKPWREAPDLSTPALLSNEIVEVLGHKFELELLDPATGKGLGDEDGEYFSDDPIGTQSHRVR